MDDVGAIELSKDERNIFEHWHELRFAVGCKNGGKECYLSQQSISLRWVEGAARVSNGFEIQG
jgi:hypothetical protein